MQDVVIIGGGPAGLAAAIYLARQKLQFTLITKALGGQTLLSSEIENYLGFHMMNGEEMVEKFKEHLNDYKDHFTLMKDEEVTGVQQIDGGFSVITKNESALETKTVLVATGEKHRKLGIPGEDAFYGRGVTYCATCDAPLFNGKEVAVIGGGYSAMESALFLEKYAPKVRILTLNEALMGDAILKKKVESSDLIEIIPNAKTTKILGDTFVKALEYEDADGNTQSLEVQGVFVEIGLVPISDFLDLVKKNKKGEIVTNEHNETSVKGIWAAGDVTTVTEKQIAVAVGEGSKAALQIIKYLQQQED
ncbi:FAD-binding protein [Candidatus Uhrbacteria bacterium]|nr:FAD-binding protein [Candidatus Uhrbacteria bacterium]